MITGQPVRKSTGYGDFAGAFGLIAGHSGAAGGSLGGHWMSVSLRCTGAGRCPRFARARRRTADRTDEIALRIMRVRDEMPTALPAWRQLEHAAIEEADQHPCAGKTEQGLIALVLHAGVFQIQAVGVDGRPNAAIGGT